MTIARGTLTITLASAFLFACAFIALFPPLLLIVVPAYLFGGFVLFHKPKRKETFETWWDDNWRDFL